jgi:CheY-like chemotaxis protein
MATILLIDDEDQVRTLFQIALEEMGYRVLSAESGRHGLRLLSHQEVDVILVDIFMPDMDGLELIQLIRKTRPASKIIAISGGSGERDFLDAAKFLGARPLKKHSSKVAGYGRITVDLASRPWQTPCGILSIRNGVAPLLRTLFRLIMGQEGCGGPRRKFTAQSTSMSGGDAGIPPSYRLAAARIGTVRRSTPACPENSASRSLNCVRMLKPE